MVCLSAILFFLYKKYYYNIKKAYRNIKYKIKKGGIFMGQKTISINMSKQDMENLVLLKKYYKEKRYLELKDSSAFKMLLADYVARLK